jgi:hypothetical protein
VLAHEISHVRNRDILIGSVAATVALAITFLARMAMWGAIFGGGGGDNDNGGNIFGLLAMAILALGTLKTAETPILAALERARDDDDPRVREAATETLGRMTVSPDGHHIGMIVDVFVPNARGYYPYVVDSTTHAVTRVGTLGSYDPSSNEPRQLTWADNQTLLIFPGISGVPSTDAAYSYNITTAAVTPLPGLAGVVEGVARCGVLFYMDFTERTTYSDADHTRVFNERIHRYNLASHAEIGSPLTIGDAFTWGGAEGDIFYPGWDVTRDGSRHAWQHAAVATGQVITSSFQSANADGSGLGAILTGPPAATAHSMAALAISPDGRLVAVTGAAPAASDV